MLTGNAQEVFTKMNDKNCVTKVEIFVNVKSYFILSSPAKGQTIDSQEYSEAHLL